MTIDETTQFELANLHSFDTEQKIIASCYTDNKLYKGVTHEMFYNSANKKIYKMFEDYKPCVNIDTDLTKFNIDPDSFFDAMDRYCIGQEEALTKSIVHLYISRTEFIKKKKEINDIKDQVKNYADDLDSEDGFEELIQEQDDIRGGVFRELDTPWPMIQNDSLFTEGKCICIICGDPGVGKSFFMTQLLLGFVVNRVKAICWGAEDDKKFHTRRAIAQYLGDSRFCNYKFLKENHGQVMKAYVANKDIIERVMKSLYSNKDHTRESLIKWCRAKAEEGYEVIGIDPITFFNSKDKAHTADLEMMEALDSIRKEYGTRFMIATHPKSSEGSKISMDGIAGGKAMSRFAQVILWIAKNEDSSRTVYTVKTRNGTRIHNGAIHLNFNPQNVCFEEI